MSEDPEFARYTALYDYLDDVADRWRIAIEILADRVAYVSIEGPTAASVAVELARSLMKQRMDDAQELGFRKWQATPEYQSAMAEANRQIRELSAAHGPHWYLTAKASPIGSVRERAAYDELREQVAATRPNWYK